MFFMVIIFHPYTLAIWAFYGISFFYHKEHEGLEDLFIHSFHVLHGEYFSPLIPENPCLRVVFVVCE